MTHQLYATSMPAWHRSITARAIGSLIKAALPDTMSTGLSPCLQLITSNTICSSQHQGIAAAPHLHENADPSQDPNSSTEHGDAGPAPSHTWQMKAQLVINTQALSTAAALCHPALLAEALRAAQAAQGLPEDFTLSASTPDDADREEGSAALDGMELLLVICMLAANACWRDAPHQDKEDDETGNEAAQVMRIALQRGKGGELGDSGSLQCLLAQQCQ